MSTYRPGPQPAPSSPAQVIETARQFGQKVSRKEAKLISALLKGRR